IPVCTHLVEAVIMASEIGDVRRHLRANALRPQIEKTLLAGCVELEDGAAELEPLSPFGPTARLVPSCNRVNGRPFAAVPRAVSRNDLASRDVPELPDGRQQV